MAPARTSRRTARDPGPFRGRSVMVRSASATDRLLPRTERPPIDVQKVEWTGACAAHDGPGHRWCAAHDQADCDCCTRQDAEVGMRPIVWGGFHGADCTQAAARGESSCCL